jgi:hypothetical protein
MASVENLIELIATKSLISGVYNYSLYERLYTLPGRTQCETGDGKPHSSR